MRSLFFAVKMFFQRVFRGFSDIEVWCLDLSFAGWVVPRLRYYRQYTLSLLPDLDEKQSDEVIDKMIEGFELLVSFESETFREKIGTVDENGKMFTAEDYLVLCKEKTKQIDEAFALFGKYGRHLGW